MKNLLLIFTLLFASQVMALSPIQENEVHLQSLQSQLQVETDVEIIEFLNKEIKEMTLKIKKQKIKKKAADAIAKAKKIEKIDAQLISANAESLNNNCLSYMMQYKSEKLPEITGEFKYVEDTANESCYSQYVFIDNEVETQMPMTHDELIFYFNKVKSDRIKNLEKQKANL